MFRDRKGNQHKQDEPLNLPPNSFGFSLRLLCKPDEGGICFPETSGYLRKTRHYNPEDSTVNEKCGVFCRISIILEFHSGLLGFFTSSIVRYSKNMPWEVRGEYAIKIVIKQHIRGTGIGRVAEIYATNPANRQSQ
jgi:hypothetical protein